MKLTLIFLVVSLALVQSNIEFKTPSDLNDLLTRRCFTSINSSNVTCTEQCGSCMKYCNAPNIRKLSSDCVGGRTCCVLTRRDPEIV